MKKLLCLLIIFLSSNVFAEPLNKIVFFGDSLSDNGNLYNVLRIIPKSPPYFKGRFSNGTVWAEQVEKFFLDKYNIETMNYATGGATVVWHSPADGFLPYVLSEEVDHFLLHTMFKDRSRMLFFIWIGANDYDSGEPDVNTATSNVVKKIMETVDRLYSHGARHFIILDLPNLSETPHGRSVDYRKNLYDLSITHNEKLQDALENYKMGHRDGDFFYMSTFSIFDELLTNPEKFNKKYNLHLKNLTDSCWAGGYTLRKQDEVNELSEELNKNFNQQSFGNNKKIDTKKIAENILKNPDLAEAFHAQKLYAAGIEPCDHPDEFVFWDQVHPTAPVHEIMANIVIEKLLNEKILG